MRLLHTSDWHLGRSLHRTDLRSAQEAFLDHLVDTVRSEGVDVVLVAGDVYDRAVPSLDAVGLCEDALFRLQGAGARVVAISGNHDSALRLGFGSRLLDAAGVHLRTRPAELATPILVDGVAVYAVPYLEPAAVRHRLDEWFERPAGGPAGDPGADPGHAGVLGRALAAVRADRARRNVPQALCLAHAWVAGGSGCESERDISVGGVGSVPPEVFAGFDYVALGHLHGPQEVRETVRYSGSPLAYSFSEAAHRKGSWLVELGPGGPARAHFVAAPVPRRLSVLRGELADLLESAAHRDREGDYLSITLLDQVRPQAAMERLRARFAHLLALDWQPPEGPADSRSYRERIVGRSDVAIARSFIDHVRGSQITPAEDLLLQGALEAGRTEPGSDPAGDGPDQDAEAVA